MVEPVSVWRWNWQYIASEQLLKGWVVQLASIMFKTSLSWLDNGQTGTFLYLSASLCASQKRFDERVNHFYVELELTVYRARTAIKRLSGTSKSSQLPPWDKPSIGWAKGRAGSFLYLFSTLWASQKRCDERGLPSSIWIWTIYHTCSWKAEWYS